MKAKTFQQIVQRKRNNIIKNAHADDIPQEYEEALKIMEDYLRTQNKRCTVERRFVLEVLYRLSAPIDIEAFRELVCKTKGIVSKATIYNTMDLLLQLKLVKRLDLFSHGMSFYEKTLGMEPHGYVICDRCGNINMLYRPDLMRTLRLSFPRGFVPEDFVLHVHGVCSKCKRKPRKKHEEDNSTVSSDNKITKRRNKNN